MANAMNSPPSYFICPECLARDLETSDECPVHLEPGVMLAGVRYCKLCGEELLDEVTVALADRLLHGRLTWGTKGHSLAMRMDGNLFTITMACPCWHQGSQEPFDITTAGFSNYWSILAGFVDEHYEELKAVLVIAGRETRGRANLPCIRPLNDCAHSKNARPSSPEPGQNFPLNFSSFSRSATGTRSSKTKDGDDRE